MPSFDSARDCHVVRIVFDGPGFAGKTTNLQYICNATPATRRSEMYTPAALKGRTMFFDWMELDGPPAIGIKLKFQLITVPGQEERDYRRRPLVEMADVVVFVCDSIPEHLAGTQRTFARLRATMKRRSDPLPLVVQANKQDVANAVSPQKLRRRLRLDADVPMFSANAVQGVGVRETLATAMRLGIEQLASSEVEPLLEAFANPDNLFDHVLTFEDNPVNDGVVDAEELNVHAEDVELTEELVAAHLNASSMDALQARAQRAASRGQRSKTAS
jgi:signal recognition particle receptor subunit beta